MTEIELYGIFLGKGLTPAAAAGALANCLAEDPTLKGNNLQDSYNAAWHISDEEYTRQVDLGLRNFIDSAGYGLFQHTSNNRKRGLMTLCKRRGKSVSDEQCQIDFAIDEEMPNQYQHCWKVLTTTTDPYEAGYVMCKEFEVPANTEYQAQLRGNKARQLYEKYSGTTPAVDSGKDTDVPAKKSEYWPPRMICKGMDGPDVLLAQASLLCQGYTIGDTLGIFGASTEEAVKKLQKAHSVSVDGVIGHGETWPLLRW